MFNQNVNKLLRIRAYLRKKKPLRVFSDNVNGLGDFMISSWILKTLKEELGAKITILVWSQHKEFTEALPFIDRAFYWGYPYDKDMSEYNKLRGEISSTGPYDIAFDFGFPPRSTELSLSARPKMLVGFDAMIPEDLKKYYDLILKGLPDESMLERDKQILNLFGIDKINLENYPLVPAPSEIKVLDRFFAQNNLGKKDLIVLMHPGAGGQANKQWGLDKFAALADKLIEKYQARIIFCGGQIEQMNVFSVMRGEREEDMVRYILGKMHHPAINIAGQTSIGLLGQLLLRVSLYIGNDSGPAHLAAALNVPTIIVWGPTNIRKWRPVGKYVEVIHKVDDLRCYPCSGQDCKDKFCLERIKPEDVIERVEELWRNSKKL